MNISAAVRSKIRRKTWRWWFRTVRQPSVLDVSALRGQLSDSPNILFLCHGNICRSPLGERYLDKQLTGERSIDAAVDSAGVRTEQGKQSPEKAVTAASEFGVDLSTHEAKPLSDELIEWSDVVLIKDVSNFALLRKNFDGWERKTYFLGALAEDESYEIRDPYGSELDRYRSLYDQVTAGVDSLVELLEESQQSDGGRGGKLLQNQSDDQ